MERSELTALLSASLARCAALHDLTLAVYFEEGEEDEQRTRWTARLHSVPTVLRLHVQPMRVAPFLSVLPLHLPQLERLVLQCWESNDVVLAQLAHPTLQQLHLNKAAFHASTEVQTHALLHNPRLPRLTSCTNTADLMMSSLAYSLTDIAVQASSSRASPLIHVFDSLRTLSGGSSVKTSRNLKN